MEKTIKVGKGSVRINNDMAWTLYYEDQFGEDISATMLPVASAIANNIGAMVELKERRDGGDELTTKDIAAMLATDEALEAFFGLSTIGVNGVKKIFWALAKCADESIPELNEWAKGLGEFYLDTAGKDVLLFALKGFVSSKNWKRLESLTKANQPEAE